MGANENVHFDAICGRRLAAQPPPPLVAEYRKRKYYFCSEGCLRQFWRHAERLRLTERARAGALLSTGRVCWGFA